MASIINASTSGVGGVITTADNSGDLNIQSGGVTKLAITSAGAAITGTLSASGSINTLTVGLGGGNVATNTAVGVNALTSNSTGEFNTAIGYQTSYSYTSGYLTSIGYQAGYSSTATVGSYGSTYVGYKAGYSNTTGTDNVYIGSFAGTAKTGNNNTAVGSGALSAAGVGEANTIVGYRAGLAISSGTHNTCLGYNVNLTGTTVHRGVYLGAELTPSSVSASSEIVISGNATTGKGSNTGYINPSAGSMYQGSNSSTWATTSDQRLKKNIIDNNSGLDLITAIQIRNFEYRLPEEITELDSANAIKKEGVQLGVIAQELQQILPECIKQESTGVLSVDTDNLTWYLINAVKELKSIVDTQAQQIAALEAK